MRDARRPSVWPVASITYHSRCASPASLVSQELFCVVIMGVYSKCDRLQDRETAVKCGTAGAQTISEAGPDGRARAGYFATTCPILIEVTPGVRSLACTVVQCHAPVLRQPRAQ